jgi:4-hydroxymandelate oxidase
MPTFEQRRRLLQWLSASPLLPYAGLAGAAPDIPSKLSELESEAGLIAKPEEAINVFDFEPVFRKNVPPAHAGYMYSGIDAEVTLKANREAFGKYYLRPRRLVDVSKVDTSVEIFGVKYANPIFICPTGGNRAYHPEGELAVARAAKAGGHLEMLATPATTSIEDAIAARGAPVWYQLYASPSWEIAQQLVKRAEKAGAPVVVVTVDRVGGRNQEPFLRMRKKDARNCEGCHAKDLQGSVKRKPAYEGIDVSGVRNLQSANMTWEFVKRMRDTTKMKIVLKGILTAEDAELAVQNGVDGIVVSNHGGRQLDGAVSSIRALPEIVEAVKDRTEVWFDGGIRSGQDVLKALALGARGTLIGRAFAYGLGAMGEAGVSCALELIQKELDVSMALCGLRDVKDASPAILRAW